MVRRDIAATKVARASGWLNDAEQLFARPVEEFLRDLPGRDLALFYLFLAIQETIDLAAHWVADAGWVTPDDAGTTFDVLAERGAIGRDHAAALRGATSLRNRIAHGYALLDYERVQRESRDGIRARADDRALRLSWQGQRGNRLGGGAVQPLPTVHSGDPRQIGAPASI